MPERRARKIDFLNTIEINRTFSSKIRKVRSIQYTEIKGLIEERIEGHHQRETAARYLCNSGDIHRASHILMYFFLNLEGEVAINELLTSLDELSAQRKSGKLLVSCSRHYCMK